MTYIKRALESKVQEISEDYSCLLLIGPRQVGKTTMDDLIVGVLTRRINPN